MYFIGQFQESLIESPHRFLYFFQLKVKFCKFCSITNFVVLQKFVVLQNTTKIKTKLKTTAEGSHSCNNTQRKSFWT